MKKQIIRILYFLIPVYLFVAAIFIIDPYEYFDVVHILSSEHKLEVLKRNDETSPRGSMLWKLLHFNRNPKKHIIIGDSQSLHIREDLVKELTGKDYFNFSIPGSSYKTIFSTFWHVVETEKPESIYFQLGFMNFNATRDYNLFHFGEDYIEQPYLYFTTKEIAIDSYYNIKYCLTGDKAMVQKSFEYYNVELQTKASLRSLKIFFNNYQYPDDYEQELIKIVDYCKTNNIDVNFIIFPVYKEVCKYISEQNLAEMNTRFKNLLKSLATTYDLETHSEYAKTRENFSDYFHPKTIIVDELAIQVWGAE